MIKREQKFVTSLQKYIKARMEPSFNWEAKVITTTNYAFNSDKSFKKELRNLLIGERAGICHKFSDIAAQGTMFDGFYIKAPGYFFIHWESSKKTYMIPVQLMADFVENTDQRSLSEHVADLLSERIIIL